MGGPPEPLLDQHDVRLAVGLAHVSEFAADLPQRLAASSRHRPGQAADVVGEHAELQRVIRPGRRDRRGSGRRRLRQRQAGQEGKGGDGHAHLPWLIIAPPTDDAAGTAPPQPSLSAASSASSSAIRACSGVTTCITSSALNRRVMCCEQFQSKAATSMIQPRSTTAR